MSGQTSSPTLTPIEMAEEIFQGLELSISKPEWETGSIESISGSPGANADYFITVHVGMSVTKTRMMEISCIRSLLAPPHSVSAEQKEEIGRLAVAKNMELQGEGLVFFDQEAMVVSVCYLLPPENFRTEHLQPTMEGIIKWCRDASSEFRAEAEPIIEGKTPLLEHPAHASRVVGHA